MEKSKGHTEAWQLSFRDDRSGGFVRTHPGRIALGRKNKQEAAKFEKEMAMCRILARHGYAVDYLDMAAGVPSADIRINGVPADLKRTGSANNIQRYARKAFGKQGAQMVVFAFETESKEVYAELAQLKRKGRKVLYWFTGKEDKLFVL